MSMVNRIELENAAHRLNQYQFPDRNQEQYAMYQNEIPTVDFGGQINRDNVELFGQSTHELLNNRVSSVHSGPQISADEIDVAWIESSGQINALL